MVRVDRLDPAKNALRGFQALQRLLERRPDLRRRLQVVACLVPSRAAMVEYRWYARSVQAQLERLQARFPGVVTVPRWLARQLQDLRAVAAGAEQPAPGPALTVSRRRCRPPGWRRR